MALNRELESMHSKDEPSPTAEFTGYSWSQEDSKRPIDIACDDNSPSPKRMIMEFTSEEETGSPIVIHIGSGENLVVTGDDESGLTEAKQSMVYLENNESATVPIQEDNIIRKNDTDYSTKIEQPEEINGFPVYRLRRNTPFLNETLELCMGVNINKDLVCHQVPPNVQVSSIFVVDFQSVRHHDVIARDKGCFGRQSSPTRHVALKIALDRTIEDIKTIKTMTQEMNPEPGFEFYKIRRHYTWHKFISGLSRVITRLEYKNELFRYGVVQFKLADEDKSFASNFKPTSHPVPEKISRGNPRKSNDAPRMPRVMTPGSAQRSTSALNSSTSTTGTAQSPLAASQCKNEIFNILQNADKPRPSLSKVADYSKLLSMLKCDEFLCDLSFCSILTDENERILNPRTFAMGELQRHWLQSFCTGSNAKSVVSITHAHKLGNVHLTALTCSLPIFVMKDDPTKHPTVLLALMTSLTNEKQDYEYLASKLRQLGITHMVYGTEGVPSLDAVLERNFPSIGSGKSIHLYCFDSAKNTITKKLDSIKVKAGDLKLLITRQILGFDKDDFCGDALVDSRTEARFRENWSNFESSWPMEFREWIHKPQEGSERSFYDAIRRCMLRPVRVAAGLGDPPRKYSAKIDNNRGISDAINELEQEPRQCVDLVKVHEVFKTRAVDSQITDFVKAMYNMGQLRLAKEYQHLTVSLLNVDK